MAFQVLTANRLSDGAVVYLDAAGGWSEQIAEARVADKAQAETLVADGERTAGEVVAPYLIDIEADSGVPRPSRFRERIRAFGPPVHPQFARATAAKTKG